MELTEGRQVVATTLDGGGRRVLVKASRPLSGRQIPRLVRRGSLGGVQKALGRLVEQGIVLADTHPSVTLFTFNRDHLGAGPLIELAQLGTTLVERLGGFIQAWEVQPQHACLFGAAARQDGDASSEVDVLLIHAHSHRPQLGVWAPQVGPLAAVIRLWTGNDASIVDLSATDLDRMQVEDPEVSDGWRRDGILLGGRRLPLPQPDMVVAPSAG